MELRATAISGRAEKLLRRPAPFRTKAVFAKVVNLEGEKGIIAVQSARAAFTPLTVQVDDSCLHTVGETAGPHTLSLAAGGSVIDCRMPAVAGSPPTEWARKLHRLAAVLARRDSLAFPATDALWGLSSAWDPVQHRAREHIRRAAEAAGRRKWREAGEALAGLSGLGPGLTPAGDDFLLGVLAVCRRWPEGPETAALGEALAAQLEPQLPGTTWLSAALLGCALEGEFSLAVRDILTAGDGPDLARAVAAGVAWGHTSGSDTLGGMLFMTHTMALQP